MRTIAAFGTFLAILLLCGSYLRCIRPRRYDKLVVVKSSGDVRDRIEKWIHVYQKRRKDAISYNETVLVPSEFVGLTASNLLQQTLGLSSNGVHKLCGKGQVFVNNFKIFQNYKLKAGDILRICDGYLTERSIATIQELRYQQRLERYYRSLLQSSKYCNHFRVVYEDEDVAVVLKPAGVHSSPYLSTIQRQLFTMEELLPLLLTPLPETTAEKHSLLLPRVCHRLDYRVSGCLLVAKTMQALKSINQQFVDHSVRKLYKAILAGNLDLEASPIVRNIGVCASGRPTYLISLEIDRKVSYSLLQVLEVTSCNIFGQLRLVSLSPITGRRHQLREHCAALGAPILGDDLYHAAASFHQLEDRLQAIQNVQGRAKDVDTNANFDGDEFQLNEVDVDPPVDALPSVRKGVGLCLTSVGISFAPPAVSGCNYSSSGVFNEDPKDCLYQINCWNKTQSTSVANSNSKEYWVDDYRRVTVLIDEAPKYRRIIAKARAGALWKVNNFK